MMGLRYQNMKKLSFFPRLIVYIALAASVLAGLFAIRQKDIVLIVDGTSQDVSSRATTVKGLLTGLGVPFSPSDSVQPDPGRLISNGMQVEVAHTATITILDDDSSLEVTSTSTNPAEWLESAGIKTGTSDRFIVDGQEVKLTASIPYDPQHELLIHHPVAVTLLKDGKKQTFISNALTVGEALQKAGVTVLPEDRLAPRADTGIQADLTITLLTSRQLTITVAGKTIKARASADTVGDALAKVGLSLQGLDYSQPGEFQPLPADGKIRVVRVRETIDVETEVIPYESRFEANPDLDIDTQKILQFGHSGQAATRTRIRYEDGVEVSQIVEAKQVILEPVAQVEGYGTRITVQTLDTPDGTVEYYRALEFYATSYYPKMDSPPWYGAVACGGKWQPGFVAVDLDYVPCGTRLYIPGYGLAVAMDTSYVTGAWIDLGYPDDGYVIWSQYVTVYFLTPIPASVPYIIPPDSLH
jgi:resuscitation-promoting factor RpfB